MEKMKMKVQANGTTVEFETTTREDRATALKFIERTIRSSQEQLFKRLADILGPEYANYRHDKTAFRSMLAGYLIDDDGYAIDTDGHRLEIYPGELAKNNPRALDKTHVDYYIAKDWEGKEIATLIPSSVSFFSLVAPVVGSSCGFTSNTTEFASFHSGVASVCHQRRIRAESVWFIIFTRTAFARSPLNMMPVSRSSGETMHAPTALCIAIT